MSMRALVVLLLLIGSIAKADAPRATPIGFDHTLHERDVNVAGGESVPCAHCHELRHGRLVGRPAHAACFGACHGTAPTAPARGAKITLDADRLKLCTNCHAEALLVAPYAGRMPVTYPPYTGERDFNLALGHKQHAAAACTQCHDLGGPPPAPHARCIGCHDRPAAKLAMTECAGCHPAAVGRPQPPELAALGDTVTSIFSHPRHAARGGAGRECTTCHAAIATTDGSELPRPTVTDCARCHDGKQAFATTAACTRCHAPPPATAVPYKVARPEARFSHAGPHAQLVAGEPCAACHALAKDGDAMPPDHAACIACHADDFAARVPKKCGACHIATEPWRHLRADRPPPNSTELGVTLVHAKHGGACTSCHSLRTPTAELQMPRGHVACTGTACHAAGSGPSPRLGDCTACHELGREATRIARRAADPWSVRDSFSHAMHQLDRSAIATAAGATLACTGCHDDLGATSVVELATPAKRTCAGCHDGAAAFSLTGTTCRKCHTH